MPSTSIPLHFFISYSRKDKRVAKKIVDYLSELRIKIWIDQANLKPGTRNWEKSIRVAIDESFGLILLASPNSSQSEYVSGEMALAESKGLPIFPLWIDGDKFIDCIPLQLAHSQYIDCRQSSLQNGLEELIGLLSGQINKNLPPHFQQQTLPDPTSESSLAPPPPGFFRVMLDEDCELKPAFIRWSDHKCMQSVLDCLWKNYLKDIFPPFSYGSSWILCAQAYKGFGSFELQQLIIPWSWHESNEAKYRPDINWLNELSLEECGLMANAYLHVRSLHPLFRQACTGIAVSDKIIVDAMMVNQKAFYFDRLVDFEWVSIENIPEQCTQRFIFVGLKRKYFQKDGDAAFSYGEGRAELTELDNKYQTKIAERKVVLTNWDGKTVHGTDVNTDNEIFSLSKIFRKYM